MAGCACGDDQCNGWCRTGLFFQGQTAGLTGSGIPPFGYELDKIRDNPWRDGYFSGCKSSGRCPECGAIPSFSQSCNCHDDD